MAAGDERLRQLLSRVRLGEVSPDEALEQLRFLPYENLGFARVDHHRGLRQGLPEVVYGQGKTVEQVTAIVERLAAHADKVLVTRVDKECYAAVKVVLPEAEYHPVAGAITLTPGVSDEMRTGIMLVTGGTADLPVAEEAVVTAQLMGHVVSKAYDVGVAGIHRLLDVLPELRAANVIVAVAGMDGALPSVVSGLVEAPVVAVPTSIGYGASFAGIAPLLSMLNSCAPGVAVVNIDNGFGAGYLAALINEMASRERIYEKQTGSA